MNYKTCSNCKYVALPKNECEQDEPTIFCANCGNCDMCPCKCVNEKHNEIAYNFIEATQNVLKIIIDKLPESNDQNIIFFNKLLRKAAMCDKELLAPIIDKYLNSYGENSSVELMGSLLKVLNLN